MSQAHAEDRERQYDRPPEAAPVVVLADDNLRYIDEIALTRACIEHPLILVDCGVRVEDFEHPGLDMVWRAMRECYQSTQACDPHTLSLTLTRVIVEVQHERERELGPEEAAERAVDPRTWPRQMIMALLAAPAPPPIDVLRNVVPNILARRKLKSWSKDTTQLQGRVVEKLNLGGVSYGDIAEEVATNAEQYRQSLKSSNGRTLLAILEEIDNRRPVDLITTGIPQIDALTHGGMYPGLAIWGGGTGDGKSYGSLYAAKNRAQAGKHTAIIGLEDPEELYVARLLADYGPTPVDPGLIMAEFFRNKSKVAKPYVDPDWMMQAKDAFRAHAPFIHFVDGRKDPRPQRIAQDIRFHRVVHDCDLVYVDYIQAVKSDDPKLSGPSNKTQVIGNAVDVLKEAALAVDAVVVLLSQYSRDEYRGGKEPTLAAYKHAGEIENQAEACILQWRDEENVTHVKIGKLKVARVDNNMRYIIRLHPVTGGHLGWEVDTGPVSTPAPEPEPRRGGRAAPARGGRSARN